MPPHHAWQVCNLTASCVTDCRQNGAMIYVEKEKGMEHRIKALVIQIAEEELVPKVWPGRLRYCMVYFTLVWL